MSELHADTHVHLYPRFDYHRAFSAGVKHLQGSGEKALCLTEKKGSHEFAAIREASLTSWEITKQFDGVLYISHVEFGGLWLFEGFQTVTLENIEILALCTSHRPPEGKPLLETEELIQSSGGIPVCPWGFGKWRGKRRSILLAAEQKSGIRLADSALRPLSMGWELSSLPTLFGTDPLNLPGDEKRIGTYGTYWKEGFEPERPLESMRELLRQGGMPVGVRLPLFKGLFTQLRLRLTP